MTSKDVPSPREWLFARAIAAIVLFVGLSVLAGWALDIPAFTSILPAWPKMAALTALALVLAALSLWLHASRPSDRSRPVRETRGGVTAQVCAALVICIGTLGFVSFLFGWNLRLDTFSIEKVPVGIAISPAGRMSLATALAFISLGSALLLVRSTRFVRTYQACVIVALLIGALGLSRYLYGGELIIPYATMAVHTAAMLLILGAGILSLRTDVGLAALLVSDRAGGITLRRLLPAAIFVPLVAGSLALYAQRIGWLETESALLLFAFMNLIVLAALMWINAASIERADAQREQAQRALRASEERTDLIIEAALDAVITIDEAGVITGWSAQAESLFGWSRAEAIGQSLAQLIIPERYRDAHRRGLKRYLETGEAHVLNRRVELSALHRNQHEFPIEIAITPIRSDHHLAFSAFVRDITERQRATAALRESQQLLQAVIDNSLAVIYVKDLDGRYVLINRRFEDIFHLTRDSILGRTDYDIFSKDVADDFRAMDVRVARADYPVTEEETAPHLDGPHTYLSVKAPLRDDSGKPYAIFGISTDITERKRAEHALRAQLERLSLLDRMTRAIAERQDLQSIFQVVIRSLEDRLPIDFGCVCLLDQARQTLSVACLGTKGQSLAKELRLSERASIDVDANGLARCVRGELVYEADTGSLPFPFPTRLAHAGLHSLVLAPLLVESKVFGVMIAARREVHAFTSGECEFLRQLSQHVGLAAHQAQLYDALQQAYQDLRQTQQTVMQQERLRALGQMASGIAHDINNALSPAALYAQSLLEHDQSLSAKARDYLVIIQRAIEDVASTVARMREFYRPRESEGARTSVDLNRVLQQVLDLTRARWSDIPQERGAVIRVETQLDANLPTIVGAENEIRDALTNLVLNAVDAMPEGGTLTLRSGANTRAGSGPRAFVEVGDTGVGMSETVRSRCIEPFFTTKGERGTGLGLAMVYGMVQRHSGDLEIESEPGVGTTMRLIFPTGVATAAQLETVTQTVQLLRILVVDDDPLLLESLQATLAHDGHEITVADGGQAGIDAFAAAEQQSKKFDVVITDLGMPHVDGRAVAASIKKSAPATPVILLTGWGHRMRADNDLPEHVDRVLSKPPKLAELRLVLAEISASR